MHVMARPSRKKSWQTGRERVSVLADLAIRKETVVRKLTELREAHDLTQERAAAKVGVTVRQWQRWESGVSVPYARNLSAIAGSFKIDESEFFDSEPPRPTAPSSGEGEDSQLDRIEQRLTEARSEQDRISGLIEKQNANLDRQTGILNRLLTVLERIEGAIDREDEAAKTRGRESAEAFLAAAREAAQLLAAPRTPEPARRPRGKTGTTGHRT